MSSVASLVVVAALTSVLSVSAATATVIFTEQNDPQPDEQNIGFGSKQTGTTILGETNQSGTPVVFTSTQMLETSGNGLEAAGNTKEKPIPLTNFEFSVPGRTFGDFLFNSSSGTGDETITVLASDGTFTHTMALDSGANALTIITAGPETMSSITVSAPGGFDSLQGLRVSEMSGVTLPPNRPDPPDPDPIPEPASMALLGAGLAGFGLMRSRKW